MTDTYFLKCLESLKRLKQGGLLERMQGIVNMSKEKVLQGIHNDLETIGYEVQTFIIPASSQGYGTKETEFGSLLPTPTASCLEGGEQSDRVERSKTGKGFILRKKNKPNNTYGATLSDTMMFLEKQKYPTPTTSDAKDIAYNPITCKREIMQNKMSIRVLKNNKPGGKLNSLFVEFLMGFPMNWTRIEPIEVKALGNTIVPQIATEIGKAIIKAEEEINEWN